VAKQHFKKKCDKNNTFKKSVAKHKKWKNTKKYKKNTSVIDLKKWKTVASVLASFFYLFFFYLLSFLFT
jgi:hypothetical protein